MDKFGIQSEILESAAFRRRGIINAFDQPGTVKICSFQLAARNDYELRAIRDATLPYQKILLTATPCKTRSWSFTDSSASSTPRSSATNAPSASSLPTPR
jgi:hypothetical protein